MPKQPTTIIDIHHGAPRHYVLDQPGLIARTFIADTILEVALWRAGNARATYQGTVTRAGGVWTATSPAGDTIATTADYIDAERALLRLRTGRTSQAQHRWPAELIDEWRARREKPTCGNCGWPLTAGKCTRLDLHW